MSKPVLSQLYAVAQLAEMHYNADQTEHKKAAWQKAQDEYEQALEAEPTIALVAVANDEQEHPTDVETLERIVDELTEANMDLFNQNKALSGANLLLNHQLIEKDEKIKELEKWVPAGVPVSGNSTTPEDTPVAPASLPLTGAAKTEADETKKNS